MSRMIEAPRLPLTHALWTGVEDVDANPDLKKVVVTGTATSDDMLAAIKKTGKACKLWDEQ
jgi:hypothetical protein